MARTIRFHLDENCNSAIADGLRRRGIDVSTTADANLNGAADKAQLTYGAMERRVIVTHDPDFLRLNAEGNQHSGFAFCAMESKSIGQIIQGLVLIWELLEPEEIANRIEYL